jgi:hypothetical protein
MIQAEMVRDKSLVIRIEEHVKKEIEEAARIQGVTISTFVVDAAKAAAAKEIAKKPAQPATRFRGVPKFFLAGAQEASRGGTGGYASLARRFTRTLPGEVPDDIDWKAWEETELPSLREAIDAEDDAAIWSWFVRHYPKCMELVPARRKSQFLEGVYQADDEDPLDF